MYYSEASNLIDIREAWIQVCDTVIVIIKEYSDALIVLIRYIVTIVLIHDFEAPNAVHILGPLATPSCQISYASFGVPPIGLPESWSISILARCAIHPTTSFSLLNKMAQAQAISSL